MRCYYGDMIGGEMITTSLCFRLLFPSIMFTPLSLNHHICSFQFFKNIFPFHTNFLNIFMIAFVLSTDWIKFNFNFQPCNLISLFFVCVFLFRLNVLCFFSGLVCLCESKMVFNFTTTKHFVWLSTIFGWLILCRLLVYSWHAEASLSPMKGKTLTILF